MVGEGGLTMALFRWFRRRTTVREAANEGGAVWWWTYDDLNSEVVGRNWGSKRRKWMND